MDIKDFKVGQSAYILDMHTGRNTEPTIRETKVEKVGREYVTVRNGARYGCSADSYSLTEKKDWGERTFLCPTMEYVHMYIEQDQLRQWFFDAPRRTMEYSLRQLREVKKILEGQGS